MHLAFKILLVNRICPVPPTNINQGSWV